MLPRHVQDHLVDVGVIDGYVTATPTRRRCPRCKAPTVAALADDGPQAPGIRADVDPAPLTALGELQALLAGACTFTLTPWSMSWRDNVTISRRPADECAAHSRHRCGTVFDSRKEITRISKDKPPTIQHDPSFIPY